MPSKSSDPIDVALSRGVNEILDRLAATRVTAPVVLIDGRSGAGKTSLSRRLRMALEPAQLLALDSVYPGWDGLRAGADHVLEHVLTPRAGGLPGSFASWDWKRDVPTSGGEVPLHGALIVEGAGVLTAASAALADVCVWVEAADSDRKRRALERDGDTYAPHWERWAAQEDQHIADNAPRSLADVVVVVPG